MLTLQGVKSHAVGGNVEPVRRLFRSSKDDPIHHYNVRYGAAQRPTATQSDPAPDLQRRGTRVPRRLRRMDVQRSCRHAASGCRSRCSAAASLRSIGFLIGAIVSHSPHSARGMIQVSSNVLPSGSVP